MIFAVTLFLSVISVSHGCEPVETTTPDSTTEPIICCAALQVSNVTRRDPSDDTYQKCSTLTSESVTCPSDGTFTCDAPEGTNPTSIHLEFFMVTGTVVRTESITGSPVNSLSVTVVCINGVWRVPQSTGSGTSIPISSVSCSQSGSQGTC